MKKLLYPILIVLTTLVQFALCDSDHTQDEKEVVTSQHDESQNDNFLKDIDANHFRPVLALNSLLINYCISGTGTPILIDSLVYCLGFLDGLEDELLTGEYYSSLLRSFLVFDEDECIGDDCQDSCSAAEKIFDESAYERIPKARIQISDRISGIVKFFDLVVGEDDILAFKNLRVLVRSCFRSVPSERLETVAFLEIWEIDESGKPEEIFKGWMFSKHSLNILEHPIYDVRIVD